MTLHDLCDAATASIAERDDHSIRQLTTTLRTSITRKYILETAIQMDRPKTSNVLNHTAGKFGIGLLLAAMASIQPSTAQTFTIIDGNVTTCTGALLDSGGEGGSGYTPNEDFTLTICSDVPGQAISLQWLSFNLSTAGSQPVDQLTIFDGDSDQAPVIGTYTGNDSPGIVSGSFDNPTGCLTLHFTSNEVGEGLFSAVITCFQPCEPPFAVATMPGTAPALICQGETVSFDASGSYAAEGFNIVEYHWQFADGSSDSLSGPAVSHAFQEPGEYVVQLDLTDDNGCTNTNYIDLVIWVSTTPTFNLPNDTTVCLGAYVDLVGDATPTTWSELPNADFGSGIFLPDQLGTPFISDLVFEGVFEPGATLQDINDLLSICLSIEHSFIGDLVIQLTCPIGQTVTMHEQGGGGTFLGIPIDEDDLPDAQGTCWDYCWSPTATNGTWAENAASTLPSGTYESIDPLSGLIGCPLNGAWTLTITDLWASDNGFLCAWALGFNPDLFPDLTQYTPALGLGSADSSSWSGNGIVVDPNDHLHVTATPNAAGVFDYVFSVTDNFGCTYSDSMQITVNPTPAEPPVIVGNAALCDGETTVLATTLPYDSYLWSTNSTASSITVGAGTFTVTVGAGLCTFTSPPFVVVNSPAPQPEITGLLFNCGGIPADLSLTEAYTSYLWNNNSTAPNISVGSGTWSVVVTNEFGCTGSDAVTVVSAQQPTAFFTPTPPSPQQPGTTALFNDGSNGNGGVITEWDWTFGELGTSNGQDAAFTFDLPGAYPITLEITTADGCTSSYSTIYIVAPADVFIPNVFTPNGDGLNDALVFSNAQYFPNNQLKVYSRWGNLVYESSNYKNNWAPRDVSEGTYYFIFTMADGRNWAGHVTILR